MQMIIISIFICKNTYQADASEELIRVHPRVHGDQDKGCSRHNLNTKKVWQTLIKLKTCKKAVSLEWMRRKGRFAAMFERSFLYHSQEDTEQFCSNSKLLHQLS